MVLSLLFKRLKYSNKWFEFCTSGITEKSNSLRVAFLVFSSEYLVFRPMALPKLYYFNPAINFDRPA